MNTDKQGRNFDCFFLQERGGILICAALKDFYNADKDPNNLCENCPFFKILRSF